MPLLRRLKESFMGGTDDRTYPYECLICRTRFESDETNTGAINCPTCGAGRVRELAM